MNGRAMREARKSSRLAWFATTRGKKFSLGCAITFGVGSFTINLLPHTLLLDQYREVFQMYRQSVPVRVSAKVKKQFTNVLNDLEIPEQIRVRLRPFTVNSFDVFHAGSTHVSDAVVGIPINFNYEEAKDIQESTLLVQNRDVDWSEADGQNLLSALMLSEDAKKFAIGREIVRCQTLEPLFNSMCPLFSTAIAYGIGHLFNAHLQGFARPFGFRVTLYTLVGLFAVGNYIFLKDFTAVRYDSICDQEMSKLGKSYIKGGQEYYSKMLERNVALRNLMGTAGAKLYSATGNEEVFIRYKHMPIVHRKLYFDEQMESAAVLEKQ